MIHFTGSANSMPADEAKPNWEWLQGRVAQVPTRDALGEWLDGQLNHLEQAYIQCMTPKSLQRDTYKQLSAQRSCDSECD